MALPKDPVMLLSFVNTQLRDNYSGLKELAAAYDIDAVSYTHLDVYKRQDTRQASSESLTSTSSRRSILHTML